MMLYEHIIYFILWYHHLSHTMLTNSMVIMTNINLNHGQKYYIGLNYKIIIII